MFGVARREAGGGALSSLDRVVYYCPRRGGPARCAGGLGE
jgi:hypothetical protein